jgi:hypothetical protein
MTVVNDENMPDDLKAKYDDIFANSDEESDSNADSKEAEKDDTEESEDHTDEKSDDSSSKSDDNKDDDGDDSGSSDDEETDDSANGEEIPLWIIEASRAMGLTDAQITDMANTNYKKLVGAAFDSVNKLTPKKSQVEAEPEESFDLIDPTDFEGLDEKAKTIIEKLAKTTNTLVEKDRRRSTEEKTQKQQAEEAQKDQHRLYVTTVDNILDSVKLDVLGVTKTLSAEQKKTRNLVHDVAVSLVKHKGIKLDEALKSAAKSILGVNEKSAKDSLRRDLDKNKKRFTSRPGSKSTSKNAGKSQEGTSKDVIMGKMRDFGVSSNW